MIGMRKDEVCPAARRKEAMMKVETTRFGTLDVDKNKIVRFTQPILGFADCQRYIIVEGPGQGKIWWLQSCDRPELAFIVMDPLQVMPDYEVRLDASEVEDLRLERAEDARLLTIVVVPDDRSRVRTNLRAPIVYNPKTNLAKQVVLQDSDYPVQYFLTEAAEQAPVGTSDAGSHP
jgi:flagellar assembly factor FliW